jgi:dihydropyrimidine dehydrogenase (NAD+) subunit PreA
MAVGAGTVQVGTSVMWKGCGIIEELVQGLSNYPDNKDFTNLKSVIGAALPKIVEFPEMPLTSRARASVDDTCNGCLPMSPLAPMAASRPLLASKVRL